MRRYCPKGSSVQINIPLRFHIEHFTHSAHTGGTQTKMAEARTSMLQGGAGRGEATGQEKTSHYLPEPEKPNRTPLFNSSH